MLPVDNQVQELYEINDDPKRKEFLDDLFSFMQRRGTPINRLPIMAKSVLDLYELYNLVIARGGLVDVINKKLWQEIIKGLHLPSSITSAAFTLRTQYMKYLYPYECEKKNLSNPSELQAAIDGNKREGRRSSYGQFDSQIQNQLQMSQVQRSPVSSGMQQMSPLSLVTHGGGSQAAHRLMGAPSVGQMPNLLSHEIEQRMMEYIKLFQPQKRPQSPELSTSDAINATLEMSRVAMWRNMYSNNNNTSPPASMNPALSPGSTESQQQRYNNHAFPDHAPIKRERERDLPGSDYNEADFSQPPAKRPSDFSRTTMASNLNDILAAAAASNGTPVSGNRLPFHHPRSLNNDDEEEVDGERDVDMDEAEDDEEEARRDAVNKLRAANSLHHLSSVAMMNHAKRQMNRDSANRSPAFRPAISNNSNSHHHNHLHAAEESEEEDEDEGNNYMRNIFGGLQFKISKAGISANGEPELIVSMEINNVTYEGSLFAAATKKNLKAHKASHGKLGRSPLSTSSPVKSTTSSAGSAVTTQMVSPVDKQNTSNGSAGHHNNNDSDMMNKNANLLEPEIHIHSPPSPPPPQAPRVGPKMDQTVSFDEVTTGRVANSHEDEDDDHRHEEDLSMKKLSHLDEMRAAQPMVSS